MTEIVNNHLARQRTELANERTFLSYTRTSLTLFVAGVSFIEFFQIPFIEIFGYFFVASGFILLLIGIIRFAKMDSHIKNVK